MQQSKISRPWLVAKIITVYCAAIFFIIQASLIAILLDRAIIHHQSLKQLSLFIIILMFIMLSRAAASGLQEFFGFKAGAAVRQAVRQQYLKKLQQLGPIASQVETSGAAATSFLEQIEALQNFYAEYLTQLILVILIPITLLIVIFPVNWIAGLILLITAPLIPLFMALIGMGVESANQRYFKSLAFLSSEFLDKLRGLITLKLFNQSKHQINAIETASENYRQQTMAVLKIAFMSSGALELFSSTAIAIVAIVLGLTLLNDIPFGYHHHFTLYKALFILLLAPEFFLPLRQLGVHYHARAEAIAAAAEVLNFFAINPNDNNTAHLIKQQHKLLPQEVITIEINNICYSYPNKPRVLNQFNLSIKPREKIAIVGPSGAGKSTLINLLMRFLTPQSGEILLNKINLSDIDITTWQQHIAFLGQTPQLFCGTIRENIRFAKPEASDAAIIKAAEKAGVMQFINQFPLGLETKIAEQNAGLSGGQAQRVALARVFLADRPVVILDEPTASLDEETEREIIAAIKKYLHDKTIIFISHRQQTVALADRIIELNEKRETLPLNTLCKTPAIVYE